MLYNNHYPTNRARFRFEVKDSLHWTDPFDSPSKAFHIRTTPKLPNSSNFILSEIIEQMGTHEGGQHLSCRNADSATRQSDRIICDRFGVVQDRCSRKLSSEGFLGLKLSGFVSYHGL